MKRLLDNWQCSAQQCFPIVLVIFAYWFLTQLTRQFVTIDGVITLLAPASGIGIITIMYGGYRFAPAVFIGACLGYSSFSFSFSPDYSFSITSIISLAFINCIQSIIGASFLTQIRNLSKGITKVKHLAYLWFIGGYVTAFIGAIPSGFVLFFDNNIVLHHSYLKATFLWWQGNALGIVLVTTILIIFKNTSSIKGWFETPNRLIECIALFGLTFISGQVIFLDWYTDSLGALGRGYWIFLYISVAAIRFGKQGVAIILLMTAIQAVYGAVIHTGFFKNDIANTNLSNFWVYIQVVATVGMLQAIIIADQRKQANYDELTTLPNRRLFMNRLKAEMTRTNRNKQSLGLIFIDLDGFKEINDSLGHHVGDELISLVAKRLKACVRESDIVSRLGGDEFTVIIPDVTHINQLDAVANKVMNIVQEPFDLEKQKISISLSAGIALYPDDTHTIEELLIFVDQAMYSAKDSGKNRFHYFSSDMQEKALLKNKLMRDLEHALTTDQIQMHYQPIVDLCSCEIVKAEALIRWKHPEIGYINPEVFIRFAEDTGKINLLGEWISNQVLTQLAQWRTKFDTQLTVAINMSPLQFMNPENNKKIITTLEQLSIPHNKVVLEITEGLLLEEKKEILNEFQRFDDANIMLAIDDFGTGYSSLSYVKKFPIQFIKIDKSFIKDMQANSDSEELVKAIIAMASALNIKVIAEGVEYEEHHNMLKNLKCDFTQGYLYSKPLPATEFEKYLTSSIIKCKK